MIRLISKKSKILNRLYHTYHLTKDIYNGIDKIVITPKDKKKVIELIRKMKYKVIEFNENFVVLTKDNKVNCPEWLTKLVLKKLKEV